MNQLIQICSWIKWFIIGGSKPESKKKIESLEEVNEKKVSPERMKQAMRSAAAHGGFFDDAEEHWYNMPQERRDRAIKKWKKRYG